jgi:hypothetical protein
VTVPFEYVSVMTDRESPAMPPTDSVADTWPVKKDLEISPGILS